MTADFAVALGKFLGAWLFLGITLAPTLILPITLAFVSDPRPEPGPILTGGTYGAGLFVGARAGPKRSLALPPGIWMARWVITIAVVSRMGI